MFKSLIHIGYGKAGSTFLHNWFQAHPHMVYNPYGIGGFTNIMHLYPYLYSLPQQTPNPLYFVTSHEDLSFWKGPIGTVGAAVVNYGVKKHQQQICQWLYSLMPNSKILATTRNFEDIIKSAYSQYIKIGGNLNFEQFLETHREIMLEFWDYDYLLNLYRQYFGPENVIIAPYELLEEDNMQFLQYLETQLSLPQFSYQPKQVNRSLNTQNLYWRHRISGVLSSFCHKLPQSWGVTMYTAYVKRLAQKDGSRLINLLIAMQPHKHETLHVPTGFLSPFASKATVLKQLPVYNNYLTKYFVL